ncbi:DUF2164 domain-containing protein [uncultured Oxalicibacterium sp.]|uniref:DUF2164 domain-containing protein n=1 Tax=uncultured Oxalicibacterium sp. TaxID=1168540 RepID=UPI0025E06178|nr:DUF2164 domain-containing protein [uncultured Oxalicibacterium sp.]
MAIKLGKETEERLITSIRRYFDANMDEGIGDLRARMLLDFCLRELGPSIYNQAIADAQSAMQERIAELDVHCYEHEFSYWSKK